MFVSIPQRFETGLLRLYGQPLQSRADWNSLTSHALPQGAGRMSGPAGIDYIHIYSDSNTLQVPAGAYVEEFEVSQEDPEQAINVARRPAPVRVESARQPAEESGTSPRSETGRFPGGDPI